MKKTSIKVSLLAVSALLTTIMAANIALTYATGESISGMFASLSQNGIPHIVHLHEMWAQGLQTEQATRNIILNPADVSAQQNYDKANQSFGEALAAAKALDPKAGEFFARLDGLWQKAHALRLEAMNLARNAQQSQAVELINGKETPLWRELKDILLERIKQSDTALKANLADNVVQIVKSRWLWLRKDWTTRFCVIYGLLLRGR